MAYENSHSLPLEVYNKSTPPGWTPGDARYPLRRYQQLLDLWVRFTDLSPDKRGPAMAARLKGSAFEMAIRLRTTRYLPPDGRVQELEGGEALACDEIAAFTATSGTHMPKQPNGGALLFGLLEAEFRNSIQNTTIASIDAWDNLKIVPGQTRHDFIRVFRLTLDEATTRGGLRVNNTTKSYHLL